MYYSTKIGMSICILQHIPFCKKNWTHYNSNDIIQTKEIMDGRYCMNYSFDVLTQIANLAPQFSQTEEKLAAFVKADPYRVVNLSISELADQCGISVSTVSRFCRHLSLNGYQDFRLELMRSLTNATASDNSSSSIITSDDSIPLMISKMGALYSQAYSKAIAGLDSATFSRVCDLIDSAQDVHFVGTGNMLPVALAAKLQFMEVSPKFHCNLDSASQALSTALMNENSLVIIFSYSGEHITATDVARFAKDHGAKVVAITRYSQSKLVDYSDEVLICSVSRSAHQYSSLPLCAGLQFIIDLLFTEFCRRNSDIATANKHKTFGVVVGHK